MFQRKQREKKKVLLSKNWIKIKLKKIGIEFNCYSKHKHTNIDLIEKKTIWNFFFVWQENLHIFWFVLIWNLCVGPNDEEEKTLGPSSLQQQQKERKIFLEKKTFIFSYLDLFCTCVCLFNHHRANKSILFHLKSTTTTKTKNFGRINNDNNNLKQIQKLSILIQCGRSVGCCVFDQNS